MESVQARRSAGSALLATNFYNSETLMAIIAAAKQTGAEIILQASPSTLDYLGVGLAASMARAAAQQAGVTAWLHLDHACDVDLIGQCIHAGFDSVMIDASEADLEENIRVTKSVVRMAHDVGVAVEAELGYVPKLGQPELTTTGLTCPEEATRFATETQVDLLAVSIGTRHGLFSAEPALDLERLDAIHSATPTPLVLHGGSGLSAQAWQSVIQRGVVKVNFASEIKDTFIRQIKAELAASDSIDLRKLFPPAMEQVTTLVKGKIRICNMEHDGLGMVSVPA